MPYLRRTTRAGDFMEVENYFSYRHGGRKKRAPNWKPTGEAVKKANGKRSRRWLSLLIMQNFGRDDWRVDLTYAGDEPTPEEAAKRLKAFIRKLRKVYKAKGKELKYIYSTEYKGHRIHHHLLINNEGITRADIEVCWEWSRIRYNCMRPYDGELEDAQNVAYYFTKETNETIHEEGSQQKWRWVSSRNLEKPDVRTEVMKGRGWKEKPAPPKGYEIMDIWSGWTGDGYPCQRVQYKQVNEAASARPWGKSAAEGGKTSQRRARRSAQRQPAKRAKKKANGQRAKSSISHSGGKAYPT